MTEAVRDCICTQDSDCGADDKCYAIDEAVSLCFECANDAGNVPIENCAVGGPGADPDETSPPLLSSPLASPCANSEQLLLF